MNLLKRSQTKASAAEDKDPKDSGLLSDMPITEHLIELRQRLIKITIAVTIALLPMLFFMSDIYTFFSQPLMDVLPPDSTIIASDLVNGFMVQLKLCLTLSIFIVIPVILYQIWSFVAPGLYRNEKRIAIPVLITSILLFYTGAAFAYFIILQRALGFLVTIIPSNVLSLPNMESYVSVATKMIMAFGIAFEIPILVFILVATGVISAASLADKRRYVIVGCAAASGVLSPPDVPSMIMLAVPMYLLFELGLLSARLFLNQEDEPSLVVEDN